MNTKLGAILVIGTFVAIGCGPTIFEVQRDTIRESFMSDYGCATDVDLDADFIQGGNYNVSGCGVETNYQCYGNKKDMKCAETGDAGEERMKNKINDDLIKRAAFDLDCPAEQIQIVDINDTTKGTSGCEKKKTYVFAPLGGGWVAQ